MVITLLVTTFVVAFAVASLVVFIFNKPIETILQQLAFFVFALIAVVLVRIFEKREHQAEATK